MKQSKIVINRDTATDAVPLNPFTCDTISLYFTPGLIVLHTTRQADLTSHRNVSLGMKTTEKFLTKQSNN